MKHESYRYLLERTPASGYFRDKQQAAEARLHGQRRSTKGGMHKIPLHCRVCGRECKGYAGLGRHEKTHSK